MAEGIRKRHSKGCRTREGGRCNCKAGWEASVYLSRENRKLRRTFARESEARSWRTDALGAVRNQTLNSPSALTVEQAAWLWLEAAKTGAVRDRSGQTYKPGTLREYQRSVQQRLLPAFGSARLADISRRDVQSFVDAMLAEGRAPSTIANTLNPLQAIYRHAVRREVVAANPTRELDMPADRGRRDRVASAAEAKQLLDALPDQDRPIWATAFYAGLRRGELLALRVSDLNLERAEIRVERSWDQYEGAVTPKSRAGVRTVPLLGILRPCLVHLADRPGPDLLFGRAADVPFAAKTINERAARAWTKANEREEETAEQEGHEPRLLRPITLHECRHTFASLLIDAGVNAKAIQEFMGHSTIEETFMRYGHLMPGARDQTRALVDAYMERATTTD